MRWNRMLFALVILGSCCLAHPAIGRGFGTIDPDQANNFRINDDEYVDQAWEVGLIGLVAYLFVILAPVASARQRIRGPDREMASLALASSAGCVAYLVISALFDSMSFPQAPYSFFVVAAFATIASSRASPAGAPLASARWLPGRRRSLTLVRSA